MPLAFVMVNTVPDKMESVLENIIEVDGVEEAYMLYGVYDIIAKINAENTKTVKKVVLNIRRLEHILSTLTLPGLQ
jgi:DNA-binding Lrp family transcriptional regulator